MNSKIEKITLDDVRGYDEIKEEAKDIIDYFLNPKKYKESGARLPRGVLFTGDTGTGKTTLIKAIVNETAARCLSISSGETGKADAKTIKETFAKAREETPCIVIIDEIDLLSDNNGAERQLLMEIDGIDHNDNILVLATATRPHRVSQALKRPGRFDRVISLNLPDIEDRTRILESYLACHPLEEGIDVSYIAGRTDGLNCASLEALVNEASLLSLRKGMTSISSDSLEKAIDRAKNGSICRHIELSQKDKRIVAYHEVGHMIVALKCKEEFAIKKISIEATTKFDGFTELMLKEHQMRSVKTVLNIVTVFLGGKASEEYFYGTSFVGSGGDVWKATEYLTNMISIHMMQGLDYIIPQDNDINLTIASNEKHQILEKKIQAMLQRCYRRSRRIIQRNRRVIETLVNKLILTGALYEKDFINLKLR